MFAKLFLLFTATSLLEIFLLIKVGGWLGAWPTISLVVITALVGSSLVRSQGIQTMFNVQKQMNQGEMPGQQLLEGMMLVIAGVLLVTPGFITDLCGLILLQPKMRAKLAAAAMAKFSVNLVAGGAGFQGGFSGGQPFTAAPKQHQHVNDGSTIEGEFERKE